MARHKKTTVAEPVADKIKIKKPPRMYTLETPLHKIMAMHARKKYARNNQKIYQEQLQSCDGKMSIGKKRFGLTVREYMQDNNPNMRMTPESLRALHGSFENYVIDIFDHAERMSRACRYTETTIRDADGKKIDIHERPPGANKHYLRRMAFRAAAEYAPLGMRGPTTLRSNGQPKHVYNGPGNYSDTIYETVVIPKPKK